MNGLDLSPQCEIKPGGIKIDDDDNNDGDDDDDNNGFDSADFVLVHSDVFEVWIVEKMFRIDVDRRLSLSLAA